MSTVETKESSDMKRTYDIYSASICTLIVYGYIHEIEKALCIGHTRLNNTIPEELIKQCFTFYFDPIVPNMIFDEYGINTARMEILNDKQVKCLKGYNDAYEREKCKGSSIRLKYGLPISVRGDNKYNIKSVSWEITHTAYHFPNSYYFIGVVSNRNTDFSNIAYKGLTDAYGISGLSGRTYKESFYLFDSNYTVYPQNTIVKVEYNINESKLLFTYGTKSHEISLPANNNEITHWYPCISLRDKNDTCKILNVTIK
eukprot:307108_1